MPGDNNDNNKNNGDDKNAIVKYVDEFQKDPVKEGAWVGGAALLGLIVLGLPGIFLGAAAGTKPGRNFLAYCGLELSKTFNDKSSDGKGPKTGPKSKPNKPNRFFK